MNKLKISIINSQAEVAGEADISGWGDQKAASPLLIAQAVRAFLANQRKAQARTKTRSEVVGSKRKIWRQKGTGRARHGDRQAPIFVGGGVAHGPTGRQNYKQKLNQKMARKAVFSLLAEKVKEKKVFVVEKLGLTKTKEAAAFVNKLKESQKAEGKIAFLLTKDEQAKTVLRNLSGVAVLDVKTLNSYSLLFTDYLFISQPALDWLKGLRQTKEANGRRS